MSRSTFHIPPFADFCGDIPLTANPDGSFTINNATQGVCGGITPPPPYILTRASVQYSVHGVWQTRNNVDMQSFQDIWGRAAAQDLSIPWPGTNGSTVRFILPPNKICAIRMDLTLPIYAHTFYGNSYTAGNPPQPPYAPAGHPMGVDFCLSQIQGDFNSPPPYFVHAPPEAEGGFLRYWDGVLSAYYAHVTPGPWYLNIRGIDQTVPNGVGAGHH